MAAKPKHQQLREQLEELCTTKLQPGDMLPGERQLEQTYGVSRITVRRAIGDLVASGHLVRARGKGTFVAPTPLVTRLNLASFSSEMRAQQLAATSRVLHSGIEDAPSVVGSFFGSDVPHIHLTRLRLGDGRPYCIDDAWYNASLVPDLLADDVENSVYRILDARGFPITDAEQAVNAVCADEDVSENLDVEIGDPLLRTIRCSRSGTRPIEWCCSLYRGDRYTLRSHVSRKDSE
ncbi:GntR family transcriptional regulator [uncultured Corynebacterium sp.]|uniref:GntR family transcriptional regulator n=1 Tax=uncultured Corynebacterium sp. TaxID=159447 RepID=UPI00262C7B9D|nr:GntR family transcriptional regulator [uncultured Corynebacterium sp.]